MKFCGLSETSPHDSVPVLIFTSVRVYIETPLINLLKSRPKLIILTKNENKVLAKTKRCAVCVWGGVIRWIIIFTLGHHFNRLRMKNKIEKKMMLDAHQSMDFENKTLGRYFCKSIHVAGMCKTLLLVWQASYMFWSVRISRVSESELNKHSTMCLVS